MSTQFSFAKETEKEIRALLKASKNKWEQRRIQCILLRVSHQLTAAKIASMVGIHTASVWRIWSRYLGGGMRAVLGEKRGGRYHVCLTEKEERALLKPFEKHAASGQMVTIRKIHEAVCKKSGIKTAPSTTYRMLHRHGWRKVVPRASHPKSNREAQENFRVFFPQNRYRWTS